MSGKNSLRSLHRWAQTENRRWAQIKYLCPSCIFSSVLICGFLIIITKASPSYAKVYFTKEEALRLVFPEADTIEKKVVYLDSDQQVRIERVSKARLEGRIFTFYIGKRNNTILGYALFGTHTIRTKPEVYIVAINPDGSLKMVEILAFYEPEEYLPSKKWFTQFKDKVLDDELWLKKGIDAVSGATLSADGIIRETRKALAIFNITVQGENNKISR